MGLNDTLEHIKKVFNSKFAEDLIEIANIDEINQNGFYLIVDSVNAKYSNKDIANISIIYAYNTYDTHIHTREVLKTLTRLRELVFRLGVPSVDNFFKQAKTTSFKDGLALLGIFMEITIDILEENNE